MKNFVFISPNFPESYWKFCAELKNNGLRVLGIGDCPYDELKPELKNALDEYYKVSNLENYEEVFRAVAFLTYKYGKIDYCIAQCGLWEMNPITSTGWNGMQNSVQSFISQQALTRTIFKRSSINLL